MMPYYYRTKIHFIDINNSIQNNFTYFKIFSNKKKKSLLFRKENRILYTTEHNIQNTLRPTFKISQRRNAGTEKPSETCTFSLSICINILHQLRPSHTPKPNKRMQKRIRRWKIRWKSQFSRLPTVSLSDALAHARGAIRVLTFCRDSLQSRTANVAYKLHVYPDQCMRSPQLVSSSARCESKSCREMVWCRLYIVNCAV